MKGWIKVVLLSIGIIFILLSAIFFLAGFSPDLRIDILLQAVVLLLFGVAPIGVVIFLERKEAKRPVNITQEINIDAKDLVGGTRKTRDLKCVGCSGPISSEDIRITDMGVLVKCPYCGKAYVLEEEPKW